MYQCRCCYCGQIFESENKRSIDCGVCDKTSDLSQCSQEFLIMMNRNQFEMIGKLKAALKPFANYACDPPCGCHNCKAKEALEI